MRIVPAGPVLIARKNCQWWNGQAEKCEKCPYLSQWLVCGRIRPGLGG
jgi:hypothetical protein